MQATRQRLSIREGMRIRVVARGLDDIRDQCHGHPLTLLQLRELVLGLEGIAGVLDHQQRAAHQEQRDGDGHHHLDEGVALLTGVLMARRTARTSGGSERERYWLPPPAHPC